MEPAQSPAQGPLNDPVAPQPDPPNPAGLNGGGDAAVRRVRGRRGWMSDSPIDGGSGWPTSAYAIIPAPAPSVERSGARPVEPVADVPTGTVGQPPAGPSGTARPSGSARRGVLVTAAAVLLLVVAIVAVALLQPSGEEGRAAGQPAAGVTTSPAPVDDGTTRDAGGAGAGGSASVVLRTGTVRIAVAVGQPQEAFDLDAGVKGTPGGFGASQLPDLAAAALGLTALNGARFSAWVLPAAAPTAAGCGELPAAQWSSSVLRAALVPNAVTCVRTSDDRFGALTVQGVDAVGGGDDFAADISFTVWKKPGD
jgi:hypothetical protein